jgi:glycosyltransferase involved in cell wall biosynthesis
MLWNKKRLREFFWKIISQKIKNRNMSDNRISVICASFLGEYDGSADNREQKFRRAVDSFVKQSHREKELIIVSDGCEKTNFIYDSIYSKHPEIKLVKLSKQILFSGNVRQAGLEKATGRITCYLDVDDFLGYNHLANISTCFGEKDDWDWVYYNDYIWKGEKENPNYIPKLVSLDHGSIGTSSIAHLTSLAKKGLSWKGCDGYGHDFAFVQRLMKGFKRYKKIHGCAYYICHIPNLLDV